MIEYLIGVLIVWPIVGIIGVCIMPSYNDKNRGDMVRGLWITIVEMVLGIALWLSMRIGGEYRADLGVIEVASYSMKIGAKIDGLALVLILLTVVLMPIALLSSWEGIREREREYVVCMLVLEWMLIIVFIVNDILLFYIFFEAILIPMFIVIGIWGSRHRKIHAANQFFMYTLGGSIMMLIGIMYIYSIVGSTDYDIVREHEFSIVEGRLLFISFMASFAVKVPMIPVHIWLPEAHVEAPTAGSVLLAGVLLKLGTYGIIRYAIPLYSEAAAYYSPLIYTLSIIGILYTSITTIRQIDLKKVIAYASVGHMGYITMGLFSGVYQAIEGSIVIMIGHGIVSSGLFIGIGILYDRYKTRVIKYYRGLMMFMPIYSIVMLLLILGNMGMPGTLSFIGEILVLIGVYQVNALVCVLGGIGMVTGGVYSIWLYDRIMKGEPSKYIEKYTDISRRELWTIMPLVVLMIVLGIMPTALTDIVGLNI